MFTEGLDTDAVRWAKEGSGNPKKEIPHSISNEQTRMDSISSRNGTRGFGLPPPSKFKSGHLPVVVPISQVLPRDDINSTSEDMSTDSDGEVYGGRYSLDSSPQDDRVPSVSNKRYHDPVQRRPQYHVYSSDVSSSIEKPQGRGKGNVADRLMMRGAHRYPVRSSVYTEDESDDSAASSEFSSTQVGASIENLARKDAYTSDGYSSHVSSQVNRTELHGRNIQKRRSSKEDFPSAPPFSGEIKQEMEHSSHSKAKYTSSRVDSHDSAAKSPIEKKTPAVDLKENHKQETSNPSSSLGPWHAVIAYDACVRLCLHAWAKGCMEAPIFLENECDLLRRTFGLQQVLLQSEEELLVKRSSEVRSEGAAQKTKKMVGKMKVQVRKVKMALDPPTGCSFSSIKPPKVKLETVRRHFANLQYKVSSGWRAVRSIHFAPRVPAHGSFSRHSLAYMQASTQYIKQVSGLLKIGVSTLRSSSAGYELQESYSCLLRLKSSVEGDAIRMQPGSGETHIFLPDSLGDDLIVEVQDSKGNHYGRVLAQVATISEDQCGSIAETMAYDLAMEVAMKEQNFQQRNLLLNDPWK
ncbi:hypothetical protein Ccrd_014846 [Cynara cardunculus var. scolymus]|uniref:Uncharacterized protein n=1 Tax=Cynara cardunculus var. scolymus TaxID=59895 RepID=A0A103YCY8_CYNCS|nr:hypothetical protein Ccrd_014846 [Cynara cardunculus var. scolymus]